MTSCWWGDITPMTLAWIYPVSSWSLLARMQPERHIHPYVVGVSCDQDLLVEYPGTYSRDLGDWSPHYTSCSMSLPSHLSIIIVALYLICSMRLNPEYRFTGRGLTLKVIGTGLGRWQSMEAEEWIATCKSTQDHFGFIWATLYGKSTMLSPLSLLFFFCGSLLAFSSCEPVVVWI